MAALRRAWTSWLTVEVAGGSMAPALDAGDWLIARVGGGFERHLTSGVVALARDASGRLLLKRVVALPGETVELRDGAVHIDGRAILEEYARGETDPASEFRALTRLDRDAYYLLGDNRGASTDSRDHGPFRLRAAVPPVIEGVALWRYWPPSRIGRVRREARRYA